MYDLNRSAITRITSSVVGKATDVVYIYEIN